MILTSGHKANVIWARRDKMETLHIFFHQTKPLARMDNLSEMSHLSTSRWTQLSRNLKRSTHSKWRRLTQRRSQSTCKICWTTRSQAQPKSRIYFNSLLPRCRSIRAPWRISHRCRWTRSLSRSQAKTCITSILHRQFTSWSSSNSTSGWCPRAKLNRTRLSFHLHGTQKIRRNFSSSTWMKRLSTVLMMWRNKSVT